jgi:hypothetical protein
MFEPLPLALGATIMVIGIGGKIGYEGGFLPIKIPDLSPNGLPATAAAAVPLPQSARAPDSLTICAHFGSCAFM